MHKLKILGKTQLLLHKSKQVSWKQSERTLQEFKWVLKDDL